MRYIENPADFDDDKHLDEDDELAVTKLHPKLKFLKDFDVNSSNYSKVSESSKIYLNNIYSIKTYSLTIFECS